MDVDSHPNIRLLGLFPALALFPVLLSAFPNGALTDFSLLNPGFAPPAPVAPAPVADGLLLGLLERDRNLGICDGLDFPVGLVSVPAALF